MHTGLNFFVFFLLGLLIGASYFALLRAEVGQVLHGARARYAIMTHVLRLAAAGLVFWLIAQHGATALLAALAGFTLVLATLKPLTTP